MSADAFLDTNILLYAASITPSEAGKRRLAEALIAAGNFGISAQVLQEFYVNATKLAKARMSPLSLGSRNSTIFLASPQIGYSLNLL